MALLKRPRAYLDWASAAPVHPAARQAFLRALPAYGNPSSPHEEGVQARRGLEDARTRIARLAGTKPRAVVFTSGATEANALAIQGRVARLLAHGKSHQDLHILYLPTMHASALKAIGALAAQGVAAEPLPLKELAIDLDAFARLLRPETVLVCTDAVCGETGIRYDTLRLRRALDAAGHAQAALHVDASQLPLIEPIERTRLGADLLALDAQKVGGIRGVGALIVPDHGLIAPVMEGGGQEWGLRPGTEPVALITAFAEALAVRAIDPGSFQARARDMRTHLIRQIEERIEGVGHIDGARQAPHILNLQLPGLDTDYLVMLLDKAGYAVSTKSACETDSTDGSKAALALTNDPERARATLRVSWGPETPARQLLRFPEALATAAAFLRR